jgi:hypothetical protein
MSPTKFLALYTCSGVVGSVASSLFHARMKLPCECAPTTAAGAPLTVAVD